MGNVVVMCMLQPVLDYMQLLGRMWYELESNCDIPERVRVGGKLLGKAMEDDRKLRV